MKVARLTSGASADPHDRSSNVRPGPFGEHISDAELVRRILKGDEWAAEMLYRRHVRYVTGTVIRLLRSHAEAEDVVQDTFVTALERLPQLRDGEVVRAWITRIAVSYVHRRLRKQKLLTRLGFHSEYDAGLPDLATRQMDPDTWAELTKLDSVLTTLPVAERIAWMLRYVEGMDLEEAAAAAGCSLATVKRRIAAAQKRVSKHVECVESRVRKQSGLRKKGVSDG